VFHFELENTLILLQSKTRSEILNLDASKQKALRSMVNKIAQKLQSFTNLLGTSPFDLSNL
jgi:hypothetical protein